MITYILIGMLCVERQRYIYCRKAFGDNGDILIAIDYQMKLTAWNEKKMFWNLNEWEYINKLSLF